jgi:hypothetical protein
LDISFLTPLGGLLAVTALVPLGVHLARQRRVRRIRAALGLAGSPLASRLPLALALAAVPALAGLAAAQPVVETPESVQERTDAEAFVLMDISRSMLASGRPASATRFERAREVAMQLAGALPAVPVGVASFTDRSLPHLFPTTDRRVLETTLADAIDVERPPAGLFFTEHATTFDVLAAFPQYDYFSPSARKRLLVVLTDGEGRELQADLAGPFRETPRIETIFVRFWSEDERIYETGVPEEGYEPDPASGGQLAHVASLVGGRVFDEASAAEAIGAARTLLGTGPTRERVLEGGRRALMPWITLAAALPLGLVLLRRNL